MDRNLVSYALQQLGSVLGSNALQSESGSAVPSEDNHEAVMYKEEDQLERLPVRDPSSTGLYTMRQELLIEFPCVSQYSGSVDPIEAKAQESQSDRKRIITTSQQSSQIGPNTNLTHDKNRPTHAIEKRTIFGEGMPVGGIGVAMAPKRDRPSLGSIKVTGLKKRGGRTTRAYDPL